MTYARDAYVPVVEDIFERLQAACEVAGVKGIERCDLVRYLIEAIRANRDYSSETAGVRVEAEYDKDAEIPVEVTVWVRVGTLL